MPQRLRVSLVVSASIVALWAAAPAAGHAPREEMGSQLQPLRDVNSGEIAAARGAGVTVERGRALVDVYVSGDLDAARTSLEDLGMRVVATASKPVPVVEGWLPTGALTPSARLGTTDAILPVVAMGVDVGAVTSEGVAAHNIPAAISALGTSGAGIDVGVISDSIDEVGNGVNDSQASGDLPPDPRVVVLLDDTDPNVIDEGRAMAEIIYDEAPGLNRILFSSGTTAGAAAKATSINNLVASGADVIADDIFFLSEPMFQDGVIAQAVDAAKAANVAYFASAGNRARQSYESTYRDSGGLHDFDPGAGTDTRNCFTGSVPTNGFIQVALQWDEPFGGATTNIDLRITNPAGTALASGTTNNPVTGFPLEVATFFNTGASVQPCVEIQRVSGSATPFMKWIEHDNLPTPIPQFDTQSNAINPDAASARGSMAVAAVNAADAGNNTPETFSSRGPNTRLFDISGNRLTTPEVRANPDLAAADGVSTTVPALTTFFGTSAAAPSAAGIAALLRSANPNATVNEVYAQMTTPANAIDCTLTAGQPDTDCGGGFNLANLAAAGLDRTGAVVTSGANPAQPTGKNGWYTGDVTVTFVTADADSPIETANGCGSITVTTDGVQTLTCNAVSGGGPGSSAVTIMRDAKPPKKPKAKGIKNNANFDRPLPPKNKVKCKSKDATSGLAKCKLKGYKSNPGNHKLKLTATDNAGNTSKSKVKYTVE